MGVRIAIRRPWRKRRSKALSRTWRNFVICLLRSCSTRAKPGCAASAPFATLKSPVMSFSAASLHAVLETCIPADVCGLVVALSGGPDSAALLAALCASGANIRDLPLRAVHIDHGLQPAAAEFRRNALALCGQLKVPLEIIAVEVKPNAGDSLEAAARDARYAALSAQLKPHECLLTAHHREDQAETFLLQSM